MSDFSTRIRDEFLKANGFLKSIVEVDVAFRKVLLATSSFESLRGELHSRYLEFWANPKANES